MVYKLVSTLTKDATNHSRMTFNRDSKTAGIAKVNLTPDTWDPDYEGTNCTLSNGDLTIAHSGGAWNSTRSLSSFSTGKYYMEIDCVDLRDTTVYFMIGVMPTGDFRSTYASVNINGHTFYALDGSAQNNNSGGAYDSAFGDGDIIGVAVDLDNQAVYFSKNGTFLNSSDPESGSSRTGVPAKHYLNGVAYYIGAVTYSVTNNVTANFGASSFNYAVPNGYNSGWGVIT